MPRYFEMLRFPFGSEQNFIGSIEGIVNRNVFSDMVNLLQASRTPCDPEWMHGMRYLGSMDNATGITD